MCLAQQENLFQRSKELCSILFPIYRWKWSIEKLINIQISHIKAEGKIRQRNSRPHCFQSALRCLGSRVLTDFKTIHLAPLFEVAIQFFPKSQFFCEYIEIFLELFTCIYRLLQKLILLVRLMFHLSRFRQSPLLCMVCIW